MTPDPDAVRAMMEGVRELRNFLNGDGQMRGMSFGDRNLAGHAFWWRGQLYLLDQVMEAVPALAADLAATRAALAEAQGALADLRTEMEARAAHYEYSLARARSTIDALKGSTP